MVKVLLDQGLSPEAAAILRSRGIDAKHVREVGLAAAPDPKILAYAKDTDRTCVTLDHDFHAHLAALDADCPSVVLIRREKMKALEQASLIVRILKQCSDCLREGAAVSADSKSIRIRRLPLRRS